MGLQQAKIESLPFVTAELNYLVPTPEKPRTYAFDPPPGEPRSTALPESHRLPIFDARPIADGITLDREGFALVRHPTTVRNFYDDKEVTGVYYPAVEAFLKATLKADRVLIFDHTVRKRIEGSADVRGAGPRQPATRVHVDQTDASGPNRVREHLPDEAEELLKGRVQVINLWRPIRGPLRDAPLAMLDGQTVAPGDLVASDLIYPNRRGETYSVKYTTIPQPTAAPGSGRTRRSPIPPPRPMRRRARASSCGRWCSTGTERDDMIHLVPASGAR